MGVLAAFIVEVALISYRGFRGGYLTHGQHPTSPLALPIPADYTGAILIYGGLGLMTKTAASGVAGLIAWGFVVATLLKLWTPKAPTRVGSKPALVTSKGAAS